MAAFEIDTTGTTFSGATYHNKIFNEYTTRTSYDEQAQKLVELLIIQKKLSLKEEREKLYSIRYFKIKKPEPPQIKIEFFNIIKQRRMPRKGKYIRII